MTLEEKLEDICHNAMVEYDRAGAPIKTSVELLNSIMDEFVETHVGPKVELIFKELMDNARENS